MGAADDLQGQARIVGLETWTAEVEPGAEGEEQRSSRAQEAVRSNTPTDVRGRRGVKAALEDLIPVKPVCGTKSGTKLGPQARGAEGGHLDAARFVPWRIRSKWLDYHHRFDVSHH